MPADLDAAKYVSFTTYKKDGNAVSLPVWVVPFEGGYAFTTDHDAFKVKRVRRDPRATLAVIRQKRKTTKPAIAGFCFMCQIVTSSHKIALLP